MPSPLSAWLDIAERENVLVAALQGLKGSDNRTGWHDCRSDADDNPQTDDVAFASRVAKKLVDDGRADAKRLVPYTGGGVGFGERRDRGSVVSVPATRDFWLRADGLESTKPVETSFPHEGGDTTRARKATYGPEAGPQVVVITIENGGHVEPSRRFHYPALYTRIAGVQSRDFEAAEEAWSFFKMKSNP